MKKSAVLLVSCFLAGVLMIGAFHDVHAQGFSVRKKPASQTPVVQKPESPKTDAEPKPDKEPPPSPSTEKEQEEEETSTTNELTCTQEDLNTLKSFERKLKKLNEDRTDLAEEAKAAEKAPKHTAKKIERQGKKLSEKMTKFYGSEDYKEAIALYKKCGLPAPNPLADPRNDPEDDVKAVDDLFSPF